MYVRVCNNSGLLYQSIVYAMINCGLNEWFIVYNQNEAAFEMVDQYDKTVNPFELRVETIQEGTEGFKEYEGSKLLKFKNYCKRNDYQYPDISFMQGYPDVCENHEFLHDIITNRKVPADRYPVSLRELPDVNEWHYLRTQKDADEFMGLFAGFHDSTLESLCYTENDSGKREATVVFDNSGWFGIAELCFEGVQELSIVPSSANNWRGFFEATLQVDAEGVFWADESLESSDTEVSDGASVIRALSLKWRRKDEPIDPFHSESNNERLRYSFRQAEEENNG